MPVKRSPRPSGNRLTYSDAGVNIAEADRAVASIRRMAKATFTTGVLTDIGSFGGCFEIPRLKHPVLVSSVDGVGTKLKVAFAAGRHDTIGEDLVNHCVNDIAVQGAVPLFFLDYLAVGKLDSRVATQIVSGIARGCKANGCALIGGETAEMPGMYRDGEYDLAGSITGIVEKSSLITGAKVKAGDILLALASTGLHTNGYSLARKLLFDVARLELDSHIPELGAVIADELLKIHRSYLRPLQALAKYKLISGAAHITGGGITDNLPRVLPRDLNGVIDTGSWQPPPLFHLLRQIGGVPENDWRQAFNLGVGMIFVVPRLKADRAVSELRNIREKPWIIGHVAAAKRNRQRVEYR